MMMTDTEIEEAIEAGDLVIEPFHKPSLQGSSYDARIGDRALLGGADVEINVAGKGSVTIRPGDFILVTTLEKFKLNSTIAGHLGIRSYYSRKGLVVLAGLQIDPGFEGHLVIGGYNASPRKLTLDYESPFLTVELHRLSRPVEKVFISGDDQKLGIIPAIDKDYLRMLETHSLSDLAEEVRKLTANFGEMQKYIYYFYTPILFIILAAVVGFGLTN